MFGKILTISKNNAFVEIVDSIKNTDIINHHVVFEDNDKRILGEIDSIETNGVFINFLGEITDNTFIPGLARKPSFDSKIRVINETELKVLTGSENGSIVFGKSALYSGQELKVSIDDLFSNHSAIFGSSGSGKTNGICRLLQNVFSEGPIITYKANLFIFDNYGEYINAFSKISDKNTYYRFKVITTSLNSEYEVLKLPVCLLTSEDILNLLDADNFSQIAIIETALNYASMFSRKDEQAEDFKNHILAKALLSIMYTNQTSSKIRDQIFDILNETNTPSINLNAEVKGVGFTRVFRDCFEIDNEGRFAEIKVITDYIKSFIDDNRKWNYTNANASYSLKDLETALNFTLYSERYLLNDKMYDSAMALKVKIHELVTREKSVYFSDEYITLEQYIKRLQIKDNMKAQIVNFNLEDIDDRFAKTIVKIFGRMFFKLTRRLQVRASYPIHMILEEAHRYVVDDNDKKLFSYNIFERIAKEGRKYGLILDLITQRPIDINSNVISQCSNFIIFKINDPEDLDYVSKSIPCAVDDVSSKLKTLQSGTSIAFGKIFKIPMIVMFDLANPMPSSSNCEIFNNWMVKLKQ